MQPPAPLLRRSDEGKWQRSNLEPVRRLNPAPGRAPARRSGAADGSIVSWRRSSRPLRRALKPPQARFSRVLSHATFHRLGSFLPPLLECSAAQLERKCLTAFSFLPLFPLRLFASSAAAKLLELQGQCPRGVCVDLLLCVRLLLLEIFPLRLHACLTPSLSSCCLVCWTGRQKTDVFSTELKVFPKNDPNSCWKGAFDPFTMFPTVSRNSDHSTILSQRLCYSSQWMNVY